MSSQIPVTLACACVVLAACDGSSPGDRVRVSIEKNVYAREFTQLDESRIRISCEVEFTARAEGPAGTPVTWQGGERRWYAGADRDNPVEVDFFTAPVARSFWSDAVLEGGGTATTVWSFWAETPFVVEHEFRYTAGDSRRERSTSVAVDCGLGDNEVEPPVVAAFNLQAPSPIGPGDRVGVSFRASAAAGLWQTRVIVSGAFRDTLYWMEMLQPQADRSAEISIPVGTSLGMPVVIHAEAIDGAGQVTTAGPLQTPLLVDVVPPSLLRVTNGQVMEPGVDARLIGQYAVGDTIPLFVIAADNYELGALVIEIGGDRITREIDGPYLNDVISVPVRESWVGNPGVAVSVSDAQGHAGPRHEAHPDSIAVFPRRSPVSTTMLVENRVRALSWDDRRDLLYFTSEESPEVIVVSTSSMTEVRRIPLPSSGGGSIDFTQSGDTLVVALPERHSIAVIDLATDDVTEIQIVEGGADRPGALVVAANGSALVELKDDQSTSFATHVDLATGTVLSKTALHDGFSSNMRYVRNYDGTAIIARRLDGCIFVWSAASAAFGPCIPAGGSPGTVTLNSGGTHVLIGGQIFDIAARASWPAHWGINPPLPTYISAFGADGLSVFIGRTHGIDRFAAADGRALERLETQGFLNNILAAGDGSRLITIRREDPHYHVRVHSIPLN